MLKMPSFDMNTRSETFVPMHCIVDETLSQAMLQFINVMNLIRVTNVSVHASMPKEDILACISKVHKQFGQLILRKIIKIISTRCQILRLKCTKFDFGWGSAPDPAGGAYSAPPDP